MTVDLDAETGCAIHGRRQRLGAPHAPQPGGHQQPPLQGAAEMALCTAGKGLEGSLQDTLGTDINPAAGSHLAVHGQSQTLEAAKLVPGCPMGNQHGVGDQYTRGILMGFEDGDRFARLHQEGLVIFKLPQRLYHGMKTLPVACGLAGSSVDDQLLGFFSDLRIEIVHQHAQGGFLNPALAAQLGAPRGANGLFHAHILFP
ncbi:MAG: hypothetical protein BWY77_00285 [bacterium ADurb.Bin431]|nr:MAG: hypothetical protein BWY77_00285 [bacterium ADurb.Bin431]